MELATQLFHCPFLITLPPLSLFLQDHGCGCMNSFGLRPRDAAGFMDVLNGVHSWIPGHHQDALSHLGVLAGLLFEFQLSFIVRPLLAIAVLGSGS